MTQYQFHPLTRMFPTIRDSNVDEIGHSIKKYGLLVPIVLFEGKILDGRHRYMACKKLNIEPRFVTYTKMQAKDYVIATKLHREHMDRGEKKAHLIRLVAEQANAQMTNTEVADIADVSLNTVKREKRKKRAKPPHLAPFIGGESKNLVVDDDGYPVPEPAMEFWSRKPEALNVLNQIKACKGQVKKLNASDPMWREVNINGVTGDLENAINRFKGAVPSHVCAHCDGKKPNGCEACKGRGIVSDFFWRQAVPVELKKKREQNVSRS